MGGLVFKVGVMTNMDNSNKHEKYRYGGMRFVGSTQIRRRTIRGERIFQRIHFRWMIRNYLTGGGVGVLLLLPGNFRISTVTELNNFKEEGIWMMLYYPDCVQKFTHKPHPDPKRPDSTLLCHVRYIPLSCWDFIYRKREDRIFCDP